MFKTLPGRSALWASLAFVACAAQPSLAQDAQGVYFVQPKNGAQVAPTFKVEFGLKGKTIGTLGDLDPAKGHHHLIIDGQAVPAGEPVPKDEQHKHFGDGQTQTELSLPPGKHTLTLQFGDGAHRSFGPAWAKTITVDVQKPKS